MGGRIGADSEAGVGSTFWIELPEAAPPTRAEPSSGLPDPGAQLPPGVVLYVEDNPANLKLVRHALSRHPQVTLLEAESGQHGLELARARRPDLVLLDINMAGMDGPEVLARLRADPRTRSVPAVAISAAAMETDIERALAAGFRRYLTKPVDIRELLREIDEPAPAPVLTAQQSSEFLLRAFQAGARDYVVKPFDRAELMARVRNLLEAQLAHRMIWAQAALLEGFVKERTEKLRRTRLQVARRLGRAAEYRDNETGNHILRMSRISTLLAERLGWSPEDCELMLNASPMHDVGKIGIPDGILLKPDRLTPEEWAVMQSHAEIGADILSDDDTDVLVLARSIALSHHERWDGSGYPRGLAGEEIPQEGRIVAVADVFDALTSRRPYKDAWPVDEAVSYIRQQAGRHFDPAIVPVFLGALPEILAIHGQHADVVEPSA